jgi:hypothetical protein
MRGKSKSLIPIGETVLALKSDDHPFVCESNDPKFSAPGNEKCPADRAACPLVHNPGAEDCGKTSQQGQEKFFHNTATLWATAYQKARKFNGRRDTDFHARA